MCVEVICRGVVATSQQQLADAMGVEVCDLVLERGAPRGVRSPSMCLCPIDLVETAELEGFIVKPIERHGVHLDEFELTRRQDA